MTQILLISIGQLLPALQSSESSYSLLLEHLSQKPLRRWGCTIRECRGLVFVFMSRPCHVSCPHGQVWPGSGPGRERRAKRGAALAACGAPAWPALSSPALGMVHTPLHTHHQMPAAGLRPTPRRKW